MLQTGFRKWAPLLVLSFALLIIILDTTILNVSLRAIMGDLNTDIQSIQWVITAYSLVLAAFTITGGRLGDLFGRKRMFITGALIFALGSFITSISTSVGMMVIGEAIIEGIGAALMMPATASLLVSNYQGRDRQIGFGIWGGVASAGAALGPVFGGFLTTYYSWRWAFRINLFVAAVVILGSLIIHEARDTSRKPQLDFLGILLSSLGMLLVVFGVIESSSHGWLYAKEPFALGSFSFAFLGQYSIVLPSIVLGLGLLGLFALWQYYREHRLQKTPLVSLSLFQNGVFVRGALIIGLLSLAQVGMSFVLPVFFQSVLGLSAVATGIAMLPMSLTLLVVSAFSAYIIQFVTPKRLIQVAVLINACAFWVLSLGIGSGTSPWALTPGFILFGIGMGLIMSQANNITLSAVPLAQAGEASGVNGTLRQLGATLGSAVMGAILLSTLSTNLVAGVVASPAIPQEAKPALVQQVQTQTSTLEFGGSLQEAPSATPSTLGVALAGIVRTATIEASRLTLLSGIIVMVLAFFLTLRLPNTQLLSNEPKPASGH
ncbi:MAG: family efflux transporter permease subunit [Patescibacteria group bacterium]|nr:family efflux transporter permease subunit [Patescibacteria group bacterium]